MAAALAQQRSSPRLVGRVSRNSSPMENKKAAIKAEDNIKKDAPLQSQAPVPTSDPQPAPSTHPTSQAENQESSTVPSVQTTEPLAPPPRPVQQSNTETPDYFTSLHGNTHFSLEPNPFEQSFGAPSTETPGKSLLPPVAALTSPALPGASSASGYNWPNSLRSGPLSPAMLAGPAGSGDYFDGLARGGFPTPNESGIRTGLTPGGGGSMFPAPSPNSQALFNHLQSGGATPSTLDFHRTAMNAAAARKNQQFQATSNPQEDLNQQVANMDPKLQQQGQNDPYAQHDATDAANGLYLLAQARNGTQNNNQYPMPQQNQPIQSKPQNQMSQDSSPNLAKRAARNASINSSIHDMSGGLSDTPSDQAKPNTRGKGKKGGKAAATNGRRKAEETPQKGPNKRSKGNNGHANVDPSLEEPDSEDEDMDMKDDPDSGKKMTDEEKRKNFLERNRVAALKCRQRKKQWLANLQAKVEIFGGENDALTAQVTQLREEIVNLKTLLLAHKDCPVSQAQGIGGMVMNGIANEFNPHANPYGMAMQNGQMPQGMQQRR